jgi:hypothetical protein
MLAGAALGVAAGAADGETGAWAGSIFGAAAGVASAACASPQMACLILSKIPILNVPLLALEHMLIKQDGAEGRPVQTNSHFRHGFEWRSA